MATTYDQAQANRRWAQKNPKKVAAYSRAYYWRNLEYKRAYQRAYYRRTIEKRRAYQRRWMAEWRVLERIAAVLRSPEWTTAGLSGSIFSAD